MLYAKIENDSVVKYPYSMVDLRKDNRSTSFPRNAIENEDTRTERGVTVIAESPQPEAKSGHKMIEGDPALVSGVWTQTWNEVLKEPDEVLDSELVKTPRPEQDWYWAEVGIPEYRDSEWHVVWNSERVDWRTARTKAYGEVTEQIEYITENGLEAWQTKVADIKVKYPKS
jgi:hypothetical protein